MSVCVCLSVVDIATRRPVQTFTELYMCGGTQVFDALDPSAMKRESKETS